MNMNPYLGFRKAVNFKSFFLSIIQMLYKELKCSRPIKANLFLWLISGVASIETTEAVFSVKKTTTKIKRFIYFLIKQIPSCSGVM